jgi:hypothetical protein
MGNWGLGTGYSILDARYWILEGGYWGLDGRCWILEGGYWILASSIKYLVSRIL